MPSSSLSGDGSPDCKTEGLRTVESPRCSLSDHSQRRGVPHPRPLGKLAVPRGRPLNNDLTGDGLLGLDSGVAFGVVPGDGLGVVFGVVLGVLGSNSGMSAGSP